MKFNYAFFIYIFLTLNSCIGQNIYQNEEFLNRFINKSDKDLFTIKTDFSNYDTLTQTVLEKFLIDTAPNTKTPSNIISTEIMTEPLIGTSLEPEYKGEVQGANKTLRFVVAFQNRIFYISINPDENRVYEISVSLKLNGEEENLNILYNNINQPHIYHVQRSGVDQDWDRISYRLLGDKKFIFSDTVKNKTKDYKEALQLSISLRDFGVRLNRYLKNKNCETSDLLTIPFFTKDKIERLNYKIDSLINKFKSIPPSKEYSNFVNDLESSDLIIKFNYINHPKDAHLYSFPSPKVMNVNTQKMNWNYDLLMITLNKEIEKLFQQYPVPTKYCIPIKYSKTFYIFYSKGKISKIHE